MKCEDFSFESVLSTDRNLNLLKNTRSSGYFIKCFYILTSDPMIIQRNHFAFLRKSLMRLFSGKMIFGT